MEHSKKPANLWEASCHVLRVENIYIVDALNEEADGRIFVRIIFTDRIFNISWQSCIWSRKFFYKNCIILFSLCNFTDYCQVSILIANNRSVKIIDKACRCHLSISSCNIWVFSSFRHTKNNDWKRKLLIVVTFHILQCEIRVPINLQWFIFIIQVYQYFTTSTLLFSSILSFANP